MGGPRRGGVFRHLSKSRAFTAAVLGCVLVTTVAMPATTGRSRADAATRRPAAPATVPGMPGIPQPGTVAFNEDFENRQSPLPVRLNDYTGTTGMTYTADQPWLENCNGWIAAFADPAGGNAAVAPQVADCNPLGGPGTPGTTAWNDVRQLAQSLGVLNGTSPASANHAVSAFTNGHINSGNPGPNFIEFQTGSEIPLASYGRFLTFSVNAAEMNCAVSANHALLDFYLYHGAAETKVATQSVDPCAQGTQLTPGFWTETFIGDAPVLWTDPSVGIKMRNAQGSGAGNDHAFDDIRLLDISPQLDKQFETGSARVGQPVRLTFTVTNTADLLAKNGWSFTDTLPSGMRVANPANASTDCSAGTINANAGDTQVSMTGGVLNAGQASCRIAVDVTSDTAGTFLNNASNMTQLVGLNPPGESDVVFNEPPAASIDLVKTADQATIAYVGQTITYRYQVTNTGETALADVGVGDFLPGIGPITCAATVLAPGASTSCFANYSVTQADLDRGYIRNQANSYGRDPIDGRTVTSPQRDVTIPSIASPGITINKQVAESSFSSAGETLHYSYAVTNTGMVTLNNVGVADPLAGLSPVTCPTTTLAPGQSTTCTAVYTTTQADVDSGIIFNVANAYGTTPDGSFLYSPPADAYIPSTPNPSIAIEKWADPLSFDAAGEPISYGFFVTNTGNLTLSNVGVVDNLPGLTGITCDRTTLGPGEVASCRGNYTTTQADLERGSVVNYAVAQGYPPASANLVESQPDSVAVVAQAAPGLTLTKTADRSTVSAGETITYRYHVVNTGNVTLNDVGITDTLPGLSSVTCEATTLAPGEDTTCTATYTATQADVDRGSIHNTAVAVGTTPGATEPTESGPSEVTVEARSNETGISVRKSASPTTFSQAGEEIRYTYRVTNTGRVPLSGVGVTDRLHGLSGVSCPQTELAPGASMDCTATYRTTQDDVNRGSIRNVATAHGRPPGSDQPIESGPSETTVHSTAKQGLTIRKTVRPKTFSRVGQLLHYAYRVTNTGTVALDGVSVADRLHGLSTIRCPQRTLAPGESMTCTATYRVRAKDLRSLAVRNRAVAEGTPPGSRVPVVSRPAKAVAYRHIPVTG
ncbi:DUF11 domain-containing protein [Spirillospora sp. NPDC052269]